MFIIAVVQECFHVALLQNRYTFINKLFRIQPLLKSEVTLGFLHRLYNESADSSTLLKFFEFIQLVHPQSESDRQNMERDKTSATRYTQVDEPSTSSNVLPAGNTPVYLNDILDFLDQTFAPAHIPEYLRDTRVRIIAC